MAFKPAAIQGHDPRVPIPEKDLHPDHPVLADGTEPNFETYLYYAKRQREKEAAESKSDDMERGFWANILWGKGGEKLAPTNFADEKKGDTSGSVSDGEYRAASSALRTASWGSVFYLITTDILGPYTNPWAFSQVGYGPGVACFIAFAIMAAYSGLLLWYMFMKLDSDRHPLRSFGDLAYRIYGTWFRHVCNILQSLQLIINVGLIILSNGQGLSQMSKFKLCFSVCNIVWMLAGMLLGQIRTLRKFGWVANLSIWLNVITLIITMGAVANTPPNYAGANLPPGPVQTVAINNLPFEDQLNGIMQMVFSYGGAMIFIEFMAEMRRPMDFWKAMAVAQLFITIIYMFFGLFVYSYQGQFVLTIANQGISLYSLQTATNAISLTAGVIAAALYGNIGVKVIYNNVFVELLRAPPLTVKSGKYLFAVSIVVYWALAFIIASAIPQFAALSALVAAVCIFQFSYTFPPFMLLGFMMQNTALSGDKPYDANNPYNSRVDTWRDWSRWRRALSRHLLINLWNFILTLACLATAVLAAYSAIKTIVTQFNTSGSATSFGCQSPVQ
ncbi:transmembrane amino acid transporter protein-domain-containing protein [Pisolithus thermaeus]|nr:transmembrane amino acid transporter protein-domain-containing protein [Pisolithus croceorrhizus]KAI6162652.1 transmembrane amino acid transporter protein-domain-containing protein [Pisolithus thermaeus]